MEDRLSKTIPNLNKSFLSAYEVAVLLDVCYETVLRHMRTGAIPAEKLGRQWRVPTKWLIVTYGGKKDAQDGFGKKDMQKPV